MTAPTGPAIVVAGFMKCATTTMHRWLASQPECSSTGEKETNFLALDDLYARGREYYDELLGVAGGGLLVDTSPRYLFPEFTERSAARLLETAPDTPIVVLYRDPLARAVSHVRHEIRRGRESVGLAEVATVLTPASTYIQASRYHECLAPWLARFEREQFIFVDQEDLESGWRQVLDRLGLAPRRAPTESANVTAALPAHGRTMRALTDRGLTNAPNWMPQWSRQLARRALLRPAVEAAPPLDAVRAALPPGSAALLDADHRLFQALL